MSVMPTTLTPGQQAQRVQQMIDEDIAYMSAGADPTGLREPTSDFAIRMGFTAERFDGYLWVDERGSQPVCWTSLVVSKQPGQGHFSELLRALNQAGYEVRVPMPFDDMQAILRSKGFGPCKEDPLMWVRSPQTAERPT